MQIHEITLAKKQSLDEGILDTAKAAAGRVGAGIQGAKANIQQAQGNRQQADINKQTAQMADKAYGVWNAYARQLEQFAASKGPEALKAFQDRSDGVYQKSLMAFVQKNLLGGNQINKLINKDDIFRLVDQLSAPKPTAQQPPAQQGAQQPPVQKGAQQPPAAPAQAKPVVAQMPAGTPQQGAQQAAGAIKTNQARVQAGQLEKTIAAQNQAKAAPPAQPGQAPQAQPAQPGQAPAQTLGRVQSTPAGAPRPVAPVPGQAPQANAPQKKKPVPALGRTVQEAAAPQNEKELFKQLVHASALAMPDIAANKPTTKKDKTVPPAQTSAPAAAEPAAEPTPVARPATTDQEDTGVYVAQGKRLKLPIKPKNPDQQPSYYYKTSNNVWTTEQGKPVASTAYPTLEKLADAGGAKEEDDPNYVAPEEIKPTPKTKRKK